MTLVPAPQEEKSNPEIKSTFDQKVQDSSMKVLEDVFALGYSNSNVITIYKDEDKNLEVTVEFRTLLPYELIDISEAISKYSSQIGVLMAEQIETLARAVTRVNSMPLTLPTAEQEVFKKNKGRIPSALDMSRIIFTDKIKSEHVIHAMFEAYHDFVTEIEEHFEDVKKKLKNPLPSTLTS